MFFLQNFLNVQIIFLYFWFASWLVPPVFLCRSLFFRRLHFQNLSIRYLFFRNLLLFSKFFRNLFIRSLFFRNVLRKKLVCLVLFGVCVTRKHFCESKYIFKLIVLFEYKRDFELIFYSNNFVIIFKNLPLK